MDLVHSYSHAGEYSPCFTELQRNFIVSRPTKLKSLIRLVKHWYRQVWQRFAPRPPPAGTRGSASGGRFWEEAGPARAGTLGRGSRKGGVSEPWGFIFLSVKLG